MEKRKEYTPFAGMAGTYSSYPYTAGNATMYYRGGAVL